MSTNEPMTQEQLDAIREREWAATDGPWAPWLDQDGQPHMQGRLMVGVAVGVIPDGDTWVEGPDVNNPVAETYTPEDRTFIAHAREDIPALLAEVNRLRGELAKAREVTEEKVEKGGVAANDVGWTCYGGAHEPGSYHECPECKKASDQLARCVLTAALGGGDDA